MVLALESKNGIESGFPFGNCFTASRIVDTSQGTTQDSGRESRKRRFRSVEEKRRIVEETLRPGASVARVAMRHGVNSHQVFGWRKLYREGRLRERHVESAKLLPVRVVEAAEQAAGSRGERNSQTAAGLIELEAPKGHLRIAGRVDAEALRVVLEKLLG